MSMDPIRDTKENVGGSVPSRSDQPLKPTEAEILVHRRVLMELKEKEAEKSNQGATAKSSSYIKINNTPTHPIVPTEAALILREETVDDVNNYQPSRSSTSTSSLVTKLIEKEHEYVDSTVAYHGCASTLLSDVYGGVASAANLDTSRQPLPRLNRQDFVNDSAADFYDDQFNGHPQFDRQPFFPQTSISVSPTAVSAIEGAAENALYFAQRACNGGNVATRVDEMISQLGIKKIFASEVVEEICKDFPQDGVLYQFFFHDSDTLNRISYPSKPFGIRNDLYKNTSDFSHKLRSLDRSDKEFNEVQLRIYAEPAVFQDPNQVTSVVHRVNHDKFDEKGYRERLEHDLIIPIVEEGMQQRAPGSLLALSKMAATMAKTAGETPRLLRLADYILLGSDDPRVLIAYGNYEAVEQALRDGKIDPRKRLEGGFTPLEIAVCTGQEKVCELLFSKIASPEERQAEADRLLMAVYKMGHFKAVELLLDLGASPDLVLTKEEEIDYMPCTIHTPLLVDACSRNLIRIATKLIDKGANTQAADTRGFNALHFCLKNKNFKLFKRIVEKNPGILSSWNGPNPLLFEILINYDAECPILNEVLLFLQENGLSIEEQEDKLISMFTDFWKATAIRNIIGTALRNDHLSSKEAPSGTTVLLGKLIAKCGYDAA